jgi:hypothetical protein
MTVWGEIIDRISLPNDIVVIGIRRDPVVHSGDRVGFVAYAWEEVAICFIIFLMQGRTMD